MSGKERLPSMQSLNRKLIIALSPLPSTSDYLKNKENPGSNNDFSILQVKNLHESLVNAQQSEEANSRSMTPINFSNH